LLPYLEYAQYSLIQFKGSCFAATCCPIK